MNIKQGVQIFLLWLFAYSYAIAAEMDFSIRTINNQQWPVQYEITLTPPLHHHAYLDKGVEKAYLPIKVDAKQSLNQQGLSVREFSLPTGTFNSDVKATVLDRAGVMRISLSNTGPLNITSGHIALDIRYQLCDEISNVCFRPKTSTLQLPLLASAVATAAVVGDAITVEEDQSWMQQLLTLFENNQENTLLLFFLMLLAGLLSVATPCVYPMLPITSMLIVSRGQGVVQKERIHAFVYLIGIVGTYVLLGLMAGVTGGAFNSFMQSAMVNLFFAAFFAFFAVSLLGYYEFSFMQNEVAELDQNTSKVHGYLGTWLMGSIAGLVISPCVGPIVFALLLHVADTIGTQTDILIAMGKVLTLWDKIVISMDAGILMGGFGLGVALPFFAVSVIKFKKLPKAGYWMNKVKYAFGFAILYFAYGYFAKALGVLGVPENIVLMLAWSLVGLWIAIVNFNVLGAGAHDQHPSRKLYRFIGVVSFIFSAWLLVSGLNNMPIMGVANANAKSVSKPVIAHNASDIPWLHNFAEAQQQAKLTGKPIFIDFYASWCANCVAFAKLTETDTALHNALRDNAVALKLVDKTPDFERFKESRVHRQLKIGLPYFAIVDSEGGLLWSGVDYQATTTMVNVLKKLKH